MSTQSAKSSPTAVEMLNAAASVALRVVTQSKRVALAGTPGPVVFQSAMKTLSVRLSPGSQIDQIPGFSVAVTYVDLKMTRAKSTETVDSSRIVSVQEKASQNNKPPHGRPRNATTGLVILASGAKTT